MSLDIRYPPGGATTTTTVTTSAWVRPADWLALPTPAADSFVGLLAVFNDDTNLIALNFSGDYTVDWGDGSSPENVATGVQAQHTYDYSTISGGTLSTKGYKQVIVVVTPQSGQQLTSISLDVLNSILSGASVPNIPWLDITLRLPYCTDISAFLSDNQVRTASLEQVTVLALAATNLNNMFAGCISLQSVPLFDTSAVTSFIAMFSSCNSIQSVPLFNTSAGTDFSYMFSSCYNLQSVPLFDTSAGTDFSGMFSYCNNLLTVPLFNTSAGINFNGMFNSDASLRYIPLLDLSAGTDFSNMYSYCSSLAVGTMIGVSSSIDYASCNMSEPALVDIFNGLVAAVGQTISVAGNWGSPGLTAPDLLIAINKGWTVAQ